MHQPFTIHPEAIAIAHAFDAQWDDMLAELHARPGVLLNEGEGGGGGDGGNGGGSGGGDGGGGQGGSGDGGNGGSGGGSGSGDGGSGDGGGENYTPPSAEEWANTQRKAREAEAEAKKLRDAEAERVRKQREDEGNFKELAETEKKRADEAEARAVRFEQERRVEKIATRLRFRDPTDVMHRLSEEDLGDDSKVEKALKDLAKAKDYLLIDGGKSRTRDVNGDGSAGGGSDNGAEVAGPGRLSRAYGSK